MGGYGVPPHERGGTIGEGRLVLLQSLVEHVVDLVHLQIVLELTNLSVFVDLNILDA